MTRLGEHKGRHLQVMTVNRMRAIAEASLYDDSSISTRLANIVLDLLDANNDNETEYLLGDMYNSLGANDE